MTMILVGAMDTFTPTTVLALVSGGSSRVIALLSDAANKITDHRKHDAERLSRPIPSKWKVDNRLRNSYFDLTKEKIPKSLQLTLADPAIPHLLAVSKLLGSVNRLMTDPKSCERKMQWEKLEEEGSLSLLSYEIREKHQEVMGGGVQNTISVIATAILSKMSWLVDDIKHHTDINKDTLNGVTRPADSDDIPRGWFDAQSIAQSTFDRLDQLVSTGKDIAEQAEEVIAAKAASEGSRSLSNAESMLRAATARVQAAEAERSVQRANVDRLSLELQTTKASIMEEEREQVKLDDKLTETASSIEAYESWHIYIHTD